ncbi:3-hydroxyacyl-CoA dehydrogenase [Thalassobacillus devorans]|uniref:3-hydroxyacyl-CoA dehydrogenase n=1 Tax=Thalassobacillus devorans TaxID=279813 RepID=A0ABQ1PPM7_9BACI|nr:SDR family oxidoreductase [Thalassobacillus devorans]NIK30402.1 3-oxoacyl-[acyl-carrier protein] reductase [Thalassobacillus devorans]GGD00562.1 3-hydroxyacyl-CoA dehydrogenase [Thalassobacillus devorans]
MFVFKEDALNGRHILVTGATGGIGYETAKAAVRSGAAVTITGRNEEKLEELRQACQEISSDAKVFVQKADLTSEEDRAKLVEAAVEANGTIDGLVNSAGIGGGGPVKDLSEEDLRKIMELNYTATVLLTQLVYENMREADSGAVVNLSSLSGLRGTKGNSAYSASKFAVTGFTQAFAHEAIEENIRVNAVCPGFVDTSMGLNAIRKKGEREGRSFEEQMKVVEEGIPSGRITKAEEVANTIVFLLSAAAENVVGESVKISGGSVMR